MRNAPVTCGTHVFTACGNVLNVFAGSHSSPALQHSRRDNKACARQIQIEITSRLRNLQRGCNPSRTRKGSIVSFRAALANMQTRHLSPA